jgi:hypothetical protein
MEKIRTDNTPTLPATARRHPRSRATRRMKGRTEPWSTFVNRPVAPSEREDFTLARRRACWQHPRPNVAPN